MPAEQVGVDGDAPRPQDARERHQGRGGDVRAHQVEGAQSAGVIKPGERRG